MSGIPDLSLPAKAPSMTHCYHRHGDLLTAAIYTLADLTDAEIEDLQRECETGCIETGHPPGRSARPAPQPRFVGQPLRAVFDYHLEMVTQNAFEPVYFIVAVEKDWKSKGVILVTLRDDSNDEAEYDEKAEGNVDLFRVKAVDTALIIVNLQIGNMGWSEEKDGYGFSLDDGDDDDADDNQNDEDDNDDGPPAPTKNIPLGYYVPIYIHSSLSEGEVTANLEPAFNLKSPEDFACRIQAKLTPETSTSGIASTQDLVQKAATLHPLRCAKNKYLHKTYIIVIDTADPDENGMLVVKLPSWDANRPGTAKQDLHDIGKELALAASRPIRIPYSCHDGLQTFFLTLANGDANWPSEDVRTQPVFVVFQYNTHGKELGFGADWIDPRAARRKPGEERLVYAPEVMKPPGRGLEIIKWNYDEAVRRFPWFCREKRFVESLDTNFFICVDGDDVAKTGLLLVRRKWDGNVWGRTRDELLGLPIDGVKDVRVPVKEALAILEKGRKGETDGMSEALKDFFL
ncbi:hypothetical protein F4861DRAFT_334462 [Xylaria intraflava]|nr:hypothetical protein F4861DRAFT_334462 [Xylaria intraflava]